jgi:dienelactone hydrolase
MTISRALFVTLLALSGTTLCVSAHASISCRVAEQTDISVTETKLADVPAILRRPKSLTKPPIVLWHGFGPPESERQLMEALPLDDVPALKVYLGLPLFGARAPEGGMKEVVRRQSEDVVTLVFEPAVLGAALELPKVIAALQKMGCLEPGSGIGVFGFSAGGAATLIALAEADVPVRAAVTLNASTGLDASVDAYERATGRQYKWTEPARALARRSNAIGRATDIASPRPPPALLILHGADDRMLSADLPSSLHAALLPHYRAANSEDRLRLETLPGMTHAWIDTSHLSVVRADVSAWFSRHL